MKIALVWPYGFDPGYTIPLALGYLKSNLDDPRHEVTIIDCALERIRAGSEEFRSTIRRIGPDVVGVSVWSPTYQEGLTALEVCKELDPRTVTVMGGAHATTYPDRILQNPFVDFVFRGESEISFPRFIGQLEAGNGDWSRVKGLAYRHPSGGTAQNELDRQEDLDRIRPPDYDAIRLAEYLESGYRFNTAHKRNAPVWVTRGCPYRCGFCTAPLQNGTKVRVHSIGYMMRWIEDLYARGIRHINIIDDNFTFHLDYAKDFCRAVMERNLPDLHFGTPNGVRIERTDRELLRLMKRVRWENLVVAPESGSARTLQRMRKKLDPSIIPDRVKEARQEGFKIHGFFIIGYPGETEEDLHETVRLIRKCRFNFFFLNNFQPLPGTPVYDELVRAGEIEDGVLPKNYSSGERAYTPAGLKSFNFPKFVLKQYAYLAASQPLNIPYMLRVISPGMIVRKVFSNLRHSLAAGQKA